MTGTMYYHVCNILRYGMPRYTLEAASNCLNPELKGGDFDHRRPVGESDVRRGRSHSPRALIASSQRHIKANAVRAAATSWVVELYRCSAV